MKVDGELLKSKLGIHGELGGMVAQVDSGWLGEMVVGQKHKG